MLEDLISRIKSWKMDEKSIWFRAIDREVQFEIIRLNTIDQLFDDGIRSDGRYLPDYSNRSVNVYGKESGAIKLHDTGEFYQSFVIRVDANGIDVIADTKKDNKDLAEVYGIEILGLTEENTEVLRNMLLESYLKQIRDVLQID